jgi:SpoVK/Ycf46/Vps4 family AAA+-type ATPase
LENDKTLNFNTRNATLMRSGEKKILHHIIKFADLMVKYYGLDQNEVRKEMKDSKHSEDQKGYIKRVLLPLLKDNE